MRTVFLLLFVLPFLGMAQVDLSAIESYELKKVILPPGGFELQPGEVSKDGKSYFIPFKDSEGNGLVEEYKFNLFGKLKKKQVIKIKKPPQKIFAGQISFTEDESMMVFVGNSGNDWDNNDLYIAYRNDLTGAYDEIRPMGEINVFEKAEAYPWISADGHRLYYVFDDKPYFTKRKKGHKSFDFPEAVNLNLDDLTGLTSIWLNTSETKIFMVKGSVVYYAIRLNKKTNFGEPVIFTEDFKELEYISGFCMSHNEKYVFMYYSGPAIDDESGDIEAILVFKKK